MANSNPSPSTRFKSGKIAESNGRKGGVASGKSKRELATFRDTLNECITDEDKRDIVRALVDQAKGGSIKAFETIRDTMGEKPSIKTELKADRMTYEDFLLSLPDD